MTSVRKELAEHGLVPRKSRGQHFLADRNILNKVVRTAQVEQEDTVLEIGPGLGDLTLLLASRAKKVVAVEIDPKLAALLKSKMVDWPNVDVVEDDILKVDFEEILDPAVPPVKVVANLPYQISTPLLFRFIDARPLFSTLTLMLQREVAERMVASPGGKQYGPLSVFVQLFSDISIRFYVKPASFFPPPKVDSAVVHMVWKEYPLVKPVDEEWFKKVVRGCLGYRRKTLMNALKHADLSPLLEIEQIGEMAGIDLGRRPGTLTIEEFARLAEALERPVQKIQG